VPRQPPNLLATLAIGLSCHSAGINHINVGHLARIDHGPMGIAKTLGNGIRFVVVDLAAESGDRHPSNQVGGSIAPCSSLLLPSVLLMQNREFSGPRSKKDAKASLIRPVPQ
jgi:hypothetical protein